MKHRHYIALFVFLLFTTTLSAQHLKGYNVAHVFQQFPGHEVNAAGLALFDALEPDVLRFPGGTIANKYHYYKPGYGFSKVDMKRTSNYINEFIRVTKAMETPPKVVFVMNLFEHFKGADETLLMKENLDALQHLLDNGMDVIAIELGNEFYLYQEIVGLPGQVTYNPEDNNDIDHSTDQTSDEVKKGNIFQRWLRWLTGGFTGKTKSSLTVDSTDNAPAKFVYYESLCQQYTDQIATLDPSIRIGIPLGNLKNKKHTAYNNFVLDRFEFIDAYVCHFYGSFKKSCGQQDDACIRKSLDWYINNQMKPRLEKANESGKEIWVTEWNALKFGHFGDEGSWIRNSAIHQEYTRIFIELFDEYGVTISNFHKLAGPMEGAAYNAIDVDHGRCYTTPIYDVLLENY